MKNLLILMSMLFCTLIMQAQYTFPNCYPQWDSTLTYTGGQLASLNGNNYKCKYYTTDTPIGSGAWELISPCGDGGIGPDYEGVQRIIGYLPTWIPDYDIKNNFNPEVVTNLNIAFLMFKQNNNNYNSTDFASIAFNLREERKVDSVLVDLGVLQKAKAKNVKVSVAIGGATDYAFLWLMTKYHNNDTKLEEIATLIATYVENNNIDGVDLDMECWWADPAISGTTDQGGRVRGDKWGGADQGPHPAGIGLRKLSQKLRAKLPNKLITTAVFGTSWYGNNYDDGMAEYMDWIGLMSYDFTGSWDASPEGPHSSLYKLPLSTYIGQTLDNPVYSAQDALEYWMGFAPAAWNHDGGFNVPKAKLAFGVPLYGYDFSEKKPNGGNGAKFVPYRSIVEEFPHAPTSYDPKDSKKLNGFIGNNDNKLYYDTPKQATEKMNYSKNFGHQGLIIWELTQDTNYNSSSSLLRAVNEAAGNVITIKTPPTIIWSNPINTQVIELDNLSPILLEAKAVDSDGTIQSFIYKHANTVINATANGSIYTGSYTPSSFGEVTLLAEAIDNDNQTSTKTITFTVKKKGTGNLCDNIPDWSSTFAYTTAGIKVKYNDKIYKNKWWTLNNTPGISSAWQYVSDCNSTGNNLCLSPQWVSDFEYTEAENQVKHNNKVYKNKWWTRGDVPGTTAAWEFVTDCTAAKNSGNIKNIIAFPTLVENKITFNIDIKEVVKIYLYDFYGRLIRTESLDGETKSKNDLTFDLSSLNSGVYLYKICTNNGNISTIKIIKK